MLSHRTPGGAQTRSKQWAVFGGAPFPKTAEFSIGSQVIAEGKSYTDWMAALASVGLGYRNADVDGAVIEQIKRGQTLPLPSTLEYEVADDLCNALGWPEQVRFVKSGSEATEAAMRIARRATGRNKVVSIGYHGHHAAHLPSADLVDVPYGSYEFYKTIDCTTAAVILEPMRDSKIVQGSTPVAEYIESIQNMCRMTGAMFIVDEMVTGFRWAIGGATELFNLKPDLACYGKAMGNGYPIACVVGGKRLMKHAIDVSSTYGGEMVGLAAAKATIGVYQREKVVDRLWDVGNRLLAKVPQLGGWAPHPVLSGMGAGWTTSEKAIPAVQELAKRGHLMHPAGINPMYSHTDEQVDSLIQALGEVLTK